MDTETLATKIPSETEPSDDRADQGADRAAAIRIRPATASPDDLRAIERLLEYGTADGCVLPRTRRDIDRLVAEEHLYVAERGGRVVGMVALEAYSERLTEVRSLVVDPESQRRRIGSMLVERCLEEARRLGVREVLAVTDRLDLFHRLGFRNCLDGQEPLFVKLRD